MGRTASLGLCLLASTRGFSTSASKCSSGEKIVASVLFERLPVVIPKIDPVVYAFQEFSFRWRQQYRREYPEAFLKKADTRGKGDYQIDYTPAPRITVADKSNDKKSLQRALDRRLYLLLYGSASGSNGNPVWHFPEKVYESEPTLRKCAESALSSVIGDLTHTYFVGNAPMGHLSISSSEKDLSLKHHKEREREREMMDKAKNFVAEHVAAIKKPEASVTDMDLKDVHSDGVDYLANICVSNPYSSTIPIGQITYTLKCANRVIVSGTIPDPGSLKGNDNTMLDVKIKVPHNALASLIKDIGADWDIDYLLELGLVVDLPVIGNFTIPLTHKGEMKLPTFKDMFM